MPVAFFIIMIYSKLASAIYNDIVTGLRGYSTSPALSLEQLEDDIIDERLQIIKEYSLKGVIPKKDLLLSINCIPTNCESIERCCITDSDAKLITHFEVPQLIADFGLDSINYIGSTDRQNPFIPYLNIDLWRTHKYRNKRIQKIPYVYIDVTPNKNGKNDGFIFNAPYLKVISVVAMFKDPKQVADYNCCNVEEIDNISFLNNEIKKRVTAKKLSYYKQAASPIVINDQIAR